MSHVPQLMPQGLYDSLIVLIVIFAISTILTAGSIAFIPADRYGWKVRRMLNRLLAALVFASFALGVFAFLNTQERMTDKQQAKVDESMTVPGS